MARIDHSNCTHPRTPAGRRACRAGNTSPLPVDGRPGAGLTKDSIVITKDSTLADRENAYAAVMKMVSAATGPSLLPCAINEPHCSLCGTRFDLFSLGGTDGYSPCCGETMERDARYCRGHKA